MVTAERFEQRFHRRSQDFINSVNRLCPCMRKNLIVASKELAVSAGWRLSRLFFAALGLIFLSLGIVGIFVPGWPTTVLCILALACAKRGSARLEAWLLNHKLIGPALSDWDENKWISARVKWIACVSIAVMVSVSAAIIDKPDPVREWAIRGAILAAGLIGIVYILTRRTKPV